MNCSSCGKPVDRDNDSIEVLIDHKLEPSWKAMVLSNHRHLNPTEDCTGDGKALIRLTLAGVEFPNP